MHHDDHCRNAKEHFGQDFKHIHLDLDADFREMGSTHRWRRHHLDYVIDKFNKGEWNMDECRAAIHHIIEDCGILMVRGDWVQGVTTEAKK